MDRAVKAIRVVQDLFEKAIKNGATDIHFEPKGKEMAVRCRVDGPCKISRYSGLQREVIDFRSESALGYGYAERRRPQDGTFAVPEGRKFDIGQPRARQTGEKWLCAPRF